MKGAVVRAKKMPLSPRLPRFPLLSISHSLPISLVFSFTLFCFHFVPISPEEKASQFVGCFFTEEKVAESALTRRGAQPAGRSA